MIFAGHFANRGLVSRSRASCINQFLQQRFVRQLQLKASIDTRLEFWGKHFPD